jgi:hypothetical protein
MTRIKNDYRLISLGIVVLVAVIGVFWIPPIPQDPAFHRFADRREIMGIGNFFDVASNLPFLLVGLAGVKMLLGVDRSKIVEALLPAYVLFFSGVTLVGVGSIYYHLVPDNHTLIWDRLPMTVAFMAFFSVVVGEYISERAAARLLYPLLAIGVFSVAYWHYTELQGRGDLRLYGLVQFLPLVLLPIILSLFPPRFTNAHYYWIFFGLYGLAKVFEVADHEIYRLLNGVSGHTLKHLIAALGCYVFLRQIVIRRRLF